MGIDVVGVAAPTGIFPLKLNYYFREAFAVAWMYVTG